MDAIWGLVAQVGLFFLNTFVTELSKRARLKASWEQFIANRKVRSGQTIELKDNVDEQLADLNQLAEELKNPQSAEPK